MPHVHDVHARRSIHAPRSTFDRIIDGGKSVFVRFDKEYSYGDEHDAWKSFAAKVGDSSADMIVAGSWGAINLVGHR